MRLTDELGSILLGGAFHLGGSDAADEEDERKEEELH